MQKRVARLTVPLLTEVSSEAKASTATIKAISCIKVLVSRALACLERNCESFARRHGWVDIWTLGAAMPRLSMGSSRERKRCMAVEVS